MRGSIQLEHRRACPGPRRGRDPRPCRCSPTVYAILDGEWVKLDYLACGWRKADLVAFDGQLAELRRRREEGEALRPKRAPTLGEYAGEWFLQLHDAAKSGRISKLTYNTYEGSWTNHLEPAFGRTRITAIDATAIRAYVARKQAEGMKAITVNHTLTPLSAMLTDAVADGLLASNPARQPRRARHGGSKRRGLYADATRPPPKYLEPVEARALLAACPIDHRPMVLAALTTGFRRGELLGLRWEDIRWADARIDLRGQLQQREFVPCKCGSEREVVLYSGLARTLGGRRQAEGYVFTDPRGRPWGNQGPELAFLAGAYTAAGLRRPGQMWHVLRHTYASLLAAGGVRRDVVEQLMGHAGRGTTSIYTHLFRDAFDGVAEALAAALATPTTPQRNGVTTAPHEHVSPLGASPDPGSQSGIAVLGGVSS